MESLKKRLNVLRGFDRRAVIGDIQNYYGSLAIDIQEEAFVWSIDDYNGDHWYEIPKGLFMQLLRYEEGRRK